MTILADQRRLIDALQKMYTARVIETHISWVLLIGEHAYKIKKAIDLGFLNYLELSSRRHFCSEELRLNRRTAPELYLEVVSIGGSLEAPQFGAHPAIEYAVKMRRFADDALVDARMQQCKIAPSHIDALAAVVAHFHEHAVVADPRSSFGRADTIRAVAMQNFAQMRKLLTDTADLQQIDLLAQATARECEIRAPQFSARRAQGFVRECHGDLHLGNIALIDDAPVPFDCIEFSPALHWIDVMDEVAFTMMDLLHHGRADHAWRYLNAYLQATGDYAGVAVLRFYLAYRAAVRAKVEAISASQSAADDAVSAAHLTACRAHLNLAQQCLDDRRPALIITHGLPGSGKTTFSQYVIEQLGAVRIRSDVERKRMFGLSALEDSRRLHEDIYSKDATRRTYGELLDLARMLLGAGYTVVVDAAFLQREERAMFDSLAHGLGVPFVIATLDADERMLRERILQRRLDASEADVGVLEKLQAVHQPLTEQERQVVLRFCTARSPQAGRNARSWQALLKLSCVLEFQRKADSIR